MPTSAIFTRMELSAAERREKLAEILARGILRLIRQRMATDARSESSEIPAQRLDSGPDLSLTVTRG